MRGSWRGFGPRSLRSSWRRSRCVAVYRGRAVYDTCLYLVDCSFNVEGRVWDVPVA